MSHLQWAAIRADHEKGHVAKAVVPYFPVDMLIPAPARARHQPWASTFHCNDGGPRHFVAFGGREGMEQAVLHFLGQPAERTEVAHV